MNSDKSVLRLLSPSDGRFLWFASSETTEPFSRETNTVSSSLDDIAAVDFDLFWPDLDLDFKGLWDVEALSVVLTIGCNQQGEKSGSNFKHYIRKVLSKLRNNQNVFEIIV